MAHQTVVLLGDVGMGKSTVVEKATGIQGISSASETSCTNSSHAFLTQCGRLQLIDTPGSNAMSDKFEHNLWIAHALSFDPVSLILLTVKADTRIDNTVGMVRKYAEQLDDFLDVMGVCVTHMDLVTWSPEALKAHLDSELGIASATCVGKGTPGDTILAAIVQECKKPMDISITSDNFLKYFRIGDYNLKVVKSVREEVSRFKTMKEQFFSCHASVGEQAKVDMVFEFQAYMTQEIVEAQKRVSEKHGFTLSDDEALEREAGHLANLANQLRAVLFQVRTVAQGYQQHAGVTHLRKCPHCGTVWAKIDGCDDATTCGNRVTAIDGRYNTFACYLFEFDGQELRISQAGTREVSAARKATSASARVGCGKEIVWRAMAPVPVPVEFSHSTPVSTEDIELLPKEKQQAFNRMYQKASSSLGPLEQTAVVRQ